MTTPRWFRPTALVILAVATLSGCGAPSVATIVPGHYSIQGTMSVDIGARAIFYDPGQACETSGGYTDIAMGTQVTVTGASTEVLALSELEAGRAYPEGFRCLFDFHVTGIPTGQRFYGVTIGRRGTIQYDEATFAKGVVGLSLG